MTQWLNKRLLYSSLPVPGRLTVGWCVGTLLVVMLSRVWLTFGTGWESILGLLLSLAVAIFLAPQRKSVANRHVLFVAGLSTLSIWAFAQPFVLDSLRNLLATFNLSAVSQPGFQLAYVFLGTLIATLPALWSACSVVQSDRSPRLILAGMAFSFCCVPIALGTLPVFNVLTWGAVTICVAAAIAKFLRRIDDAVVEKSEERAFTENSKPLDWLLIFSSGAALSLGIFVIRQIVLANLVTEFSIWAALLVGGLVASLLRRTESGVSWMVLTVWSGAMLCGYSSLTWIAFQETLNLSNTWFLFLSREMIILAIMTPLGFVWWKTVANQPSIRRSRISLAVIASGLGCLTATGIKLSPQVWLMVLTATGLAISALMFFVQPQSSMPARIRQFGFGLTTSLAVVAFAFSSQFNPSQSEKTLYSGNTYAAARAGLPFDQLQWVDDGRLLEEFNFVDGRWSVWRHRGEQTMIRRDGIPTGLHSPGQLSCPQTAAEVMPAWLPLVVHPSAEHVLVLGLHPTSLSTCESFPLLSVTVLDGAETPARIREEIRSDLATPDLFRFISSDLVTGVTSKHQQKYDVIVCPQTVMTTTSGNRQLTQEFYATSKRKLAEQGVFCQRISYVDLGAKTVSGVLATFRSQFDEVLVTESVPGELLLVGSTTLGPLMTEATLERFQSRHARKVLSDVGWDWAVPMIHGALNTAGVDDMIAETSNRFSISKPAEAFQIPVEVSRWANKLSETRMVLTKHGDTLIGLLGDSPSSNDVAQRLADLQLAHQVIQNNPDHIWGYRTAIKKQLTDRPRSKIMQASGGGLKNQLHPEDQKRKDYLSTLGKLANSESLDVSELGRLIAFSEPFDPLLSQFSYHEAIQFMNRVDVADSRSTKLDLLLHTVYFSTGTDRSVRNICEAISILTDEKFEEFNNEQRWDHLNSLLEVLRHRWQLRFAVANMRSKYELVDTEKSLEAIAASLDLMERLSVISKDEWTLRRDFIEEHLVVPLKQYRSRQLAQVPVVKPVKMQVPK